MKPARSLEDALLFDVVLFLRGEWTAPRYWVLAGGVDGLNSSVSRALDFLWLRGRCGMSAT